MPIWYGRDAENVKKAQMVVLIGVKCKTRSVPNCGFCSFADCRECTKKGGNCAYPYLGKMSFLTEQSISNRKSQYYMVGKKGWIRQKHDGSKCQSVENYGWVKIVEGNGKTFALSEEGKAILDKAIPLWEKTQKKIEEKAGIEEAGRALTIEDDIPENWKCAFNLLKRGMPHDKLSKIIWMF